MLKYKCKHCGQEFLSYKKNAKYCSQKCHYLDLLIKIKINCSLCNKKLEIIPSRIRKCKLHFCSRKCVTKYYAIKRNKKIKLNCKICKKEIIIKKSHFLKGEGKYCSYKCMGISKKGKKISEEHRIKMSISRKGRIVWNKGKKCPQLSKALKGKFLGSKSPSWKGGITSLWQSIRSLPESKTWRENIFKRDNYTCKYCNDNQGHNLNAHHIKPFKEIIKDFLKEYSQFSPIEDKETLVRLAITYKSFWQIDNGITLCKNCHNSIYANKDYHNNSIRDS